MFVPCAEEQPDVQQERAADKVAEVPANTNVEEKQVRHALLLTTPSELTIAMHALPAGWTQEHDCLNSTVLWSDCLRPCFCRHLHLSVQTLHAGGATHAREEPCSECPSDAQAE